MEKDLRILWVAVIAYVLISVLATAGILMFAFLVIRRLFPVAATSAYSP